MTALTPAGEAPSLDGMALDGMALPGSRKQEANIAHLVSVVSHRLDRTLGEARRPLRRTNKRAAGVNSCRSDAYGRLPTCQARRFPT